MFSCSFQMSQLSGKTDHLYLTDLEDLPMSPDNEELRSFPLLGRSQAYHLPTRRETRRAESYLVGGHLFNVGMLACSHANKHVDGLDANEWLPSL